MQVLCLVGIVFLPWATSDSFGSSTDPAGFNNPEYEVFLFKSCVQDDCTSAEHPIVQAWKSAGIVALCGVGMMAAMLAAMVGTIAARTSWIQGVRIMGMLAQGLMLGAWILASIGFQHLDEIDQCAALIASGRRLCEWDTGVGMWLWFIGIVIFFLSSWLSVPLAVPYKPSNKADSEWGHR